MKKFAVINGSLLAVLLAGFLVEALGGGAVLRSIGSVPVYFFLPGYNLSYLFFPKTLRPLERVILALFSSFILVALSVFMVSSLGQTGLAGIASITTVSFCLLTFFAGLAGMGFLKKRSEKPQLHSYTVLIAALGAYAVTLLAIFLIYPFLPESDPYVYVKTIGEVLQTNPIASTLLPRPLFTVFIASLSVVSKIPLYDIFKWLLPLFGAIMLLPLYAQAERSVRDKFLQCILTILPITIPVVMLEGVITRPQLVIMIVFPGMLYLLSRALAYKSLGLAAYLTVLSVVLIKFHELGLILVFISLMTAAVLSWPYVKRRPKTSAAFFILGLLALEPYMSASGGLGIVTGITKIVIARLFPLDFRIWFLSHYANIDGVEVGWPGISWVFYYGYEIGFALTCAVIFLVVLMVRKKVPFRWPGIEQLPIVTSLILFLIIAEVLPRFNVPYLPDRAWLFLVLSFCLIIPGLAKRYEAILSTPRARIVIGAICVASMASGLYVTYAKQGWITRNEYKAAQFLKNSTPKDSVVISQGGNGQVIEYFGGRIPIVRDVFTKGLTSEQIVGQLSSLRTQQLETRQTLLDKKKQLIDLLNQTILLPYDATGADITTIRQTRLKVYNQVIEVDDMLKKNDKVVLPVHPPVYVLYSQDKFKSLYGQRSWWRTLNYADASLDVFADKRYFDQVYAQDGVTIWQVKY